MRSSAVCLSLMMLAQAAWAFEPAMPTAAKRFAEAGTEETPDFQRHVVPLLGKLGCNGRACHGSFQGRGGFRLSLFGYDFKADHEELVSRVDTDDPAGSYALQKPLMEVPHEGGRRLKLGTWQYNLLLNWINAKAPERAADAAKLVELEVSPAEILFANDADETRLTAVAVWSDGTREDVTDLCRFQSNDEQVAEINNRGVVAAGTPGDTHVVVFYDNAVVPVPVLRPVSDKNGADYPETPTPTHVDQLVVNKLKKLGVVQSGLSSDEEFLRRVSLDVTGALPTVAEIKEFAADQSQDKRARKIDELLERPGYAAWWATKLCDFTGNSDDQLNNVTLVRQAASQHWYDWIHERVKSNVAYDKIVEGLVMAVSRDPGESYEEYCAKMSSLYVKGNDYSYAEREFMPHYWSRRNFQANEDRVIGFAYTFLGIRIQCAQCHKHPFDQWTQDDFKGFQGFFTGTVGRNQNPRPDMRDQYKEMLAKFETKELRGNQLRNELRKYAQAGEIVPFGEVYTTPPPKRKVVQTKGKKRPARRGNGRTATKARLLGEDEIDLTQYEDIREPLMAWLRSPENPLFSRAFVNRVWAAYFNVGIVNPSDDMSLANPPSNAPLLDYLAKGFIENEFDMKWLHREILNSRTYQLSWRPNETNRLDERNFARAVPRRLPAEIAWDIVSQAVSNDERYAQYVTSLEDRSIAFPGAGQRYAQRGGDGYALAIFGRSIRESNCDCDRSEEPSLLQTIFLRNDADVLGKLDSRNGWLAQVAKQNGIRFTSKSPDTADRARQAAKAKQRAALAKRIKPLQQQLKKLSGETDPASQKKIARLQGQLKSLRRKVASLNATDAQPGGDNTESKSSIDVTSAVEDAWLRTLSRRPNESELQTAVEFVSEAKSQLDGLRDVMWALLNTKEFIVNH